MSNKSSTDFADHQAYQVQRFVFGLLADIDYFISKDIECIFSIEKIKNKDREESLN